MTTHIKLNWLHRISILCFLLIPLSSLAQKTKMIPFELKDQFKTEYTEQSWPDSILISLGSNKAGNIYNHIWAKAIQDSTSIIFPKTPIKQIGIANLKGVPFFLKGFIRGKFPDEGDVWILMDWKGQFSRSYHFVADQCNILIFDRKRNLVYQTSVTELNDLKLRAILEVLRKIE